MKLNDVCELIIDTEHKTAPNVEIGIPSIRTPNVGKGRLILDKDLKFVDVPTFEEWTRRAVPQINDLIIAREAPVGNVAIVPDIQLCLGQRTVLARPDKNKVNPNYLCYYLNSPKMQHKMLAGAGGSTVAHLNMKDIRGLELETIPPLPTQRKIASILSAYDDLIENNLKRIKLLEEKAAMEYKLLFNNNKLFEFPIEVVWEIKYGKNLPQTKITELGKYPVYGAAGRIGFYEEFNYEHPVALVTSRGNGSGVAHRTNQSAFVTNNSFALVPKSDFSEVHFHLAEMILRDLELTQLRSGTAQPQLTIAGLIGVKLKLPKNEVLIEFNKIVDPVFDLIFTLEKQNTKLREARDILLPKLMNGQIEV